MGLGGAAVTAGCRNDAPPPQRVPVPAASNRDQLHERDYVKPMPDEVAVEPRPERPEPVQPEPRRETPPPPDTRDTRETRDTRDNGGRLDPAQVTRDFLDAYHKVGEPRFIIFVNRTLNGEVIPVNDYQETKGRYLRPGEYDEANARDIDYAALENQLAEVVGQGGKVMVISPTVARDKLGESQAKDLQDGQAQVLSALDTRLGADVLIHVQIHPTKQTSRGLEFRVVAEAVNVKGGQSVGHAFADVERPLDQEQIRGLSQYLGTKLMADMISSWSAPLPPDAGSRDARPPASAPPKE
jgi:hypothetical protein